MLVGPKVTIKVGRLGAGGWGRKTGEANRLRFASRSLEERRSNLAFEIVNFEMELKPKNLEVAAFCEAFGSLPQRG
jgi:hypothetical protein